LLKAIETMTRKSIDEQVEILKITTERVGKSSKAASEFLRSAGIFTNKNDAGRTESQTYSSKGARAYHPKSSGKFVVKKNK
jgi:hypothetical protein